MAMKLSQHSDIGINRRVFLQRMAALVLLPWIPSLASAGSDPGADSLPWTTVALIAVGGGGLHSIKGLASSEWITQCRFVGVDADHRDIADCKCPHKVEFELIYPGFREVDYPKIARQATLDKADAILAASGRPAMAVVIATLGGGMGSGAGPVIARLLKNTGVQTVAVVSTPFPFEGRRRHSQALTGLKAFRETADITIVVEYERLLTGFSKGTSLAQAYREADRAITRAVSKLLDRASII